MSKDTRYVPIPLADVPVDKAIPFNLYHPSSIGGKLVLVCRKGSSLTDKKVQSLRKGGVKKLFVPTTEWKHVEGPPEKIHHQPVKTSKPVRTSAEKLHAEAVRIHSQVSQAMLDVLNDPKGEHVQAVCSHITEVASSILENGAMLKHLISLQSHDYHTYTHSVNVSIYCLGFGFHLGHQDSEVLSALGIGGLLHDIGKSFIDKDILTKPKRLNPKEWEQIRTHPLVGAEFLAKHQVVSPSSIVVVLQHHEYYDGSGYPRGLAGNDIHLFGRIGCLAEVYDALTSNQRYRRAFSLTKARMLMFTEMRGHFDEKLLKEFMKFIRRYSFS